MNVMKDFYYIAPLISKIDKRIILAVTLVFAAIGLGWGICQYRKHQFDPRNRKFNHLEVYGLESQEVRIARLQKENPDLKILADETLLPLNRNRKE